MKEVEMAETFTVRPMGNRVLVERTESETVTAGGVFIPDCAQEKRAEGVVRAVGPGGFASDGSRLPMDVAVGDRVVFSRYSGTDARVNGTDYLLIPVTDVVAVLDPVG